MRLFIIFYLFCLVIVPSQAASRWPDKPLGGGEKLFFGEKEIVDIRERIDKYDWAANLYEKFKCEIDNPRSRVDNHRGWGESLRIRDAALYYRISGDEKYLTQVVNGIVRNFSLDNVDNKKLFPDTTKSNPNLWTWLMFRGGYFHAYDLIKTHPLMQSYAFAMEQRLDEIIAESERYTKGIRRASNTHFWTVTLGLGVAGFMRDNKKAVDSALYNDRYGMEAFLNELRDGGRFVPEPMRYGYDYVACCMTILAQAAKFNNVADLYNYQSKNSGSMRKMIDGYLTVANSAGMLPVNGDMGEFTATDSIRMYYEAPRIFNNENVMRTNQKWELYNYVYRDPRFAWVVSRNPARDEYDYTFWGFTGIVFALPLDNIEYPEAKSVVLHQMGDAYIRAVEDREQYWNDETTTIHVRKGANLVTHNHNDHFHFTLNAFAKNIYTDWFYQYDYLAPRSANNFANATPMSERILAHNTVDVDFAEPKNSDIIYSEVLRNNGMQIFSAEGSIYDGVKQRRTFGVTKDYILDIFDLSSIDQHNYDYIIHSLGQISIDGVDSWSDYSKINEDYSLSPIDKWAKRERNVWIADARKGSAKENNVTVVFRDSDGIGSVLTILDNDPSEVITGGVPYFLDKYSWDTQAGLQGVPERKPILVVRRTTPTTTYYVVHQPFKGGAAKGVKLSKDGYIITIEGEGFVDTYNLNTKEYKRKNN